MSHGRSCAGPRTREVGKHLGEVAVSYGEGDTDPRNDRVSFDKVASQLGFPCEDRRADLAVGSPREFWTSVLSLITGWVQRRQHIAVLAPVQRSCRGVELTAGVATRHARECDRVGQDRCSGPD